MSRFSGKCDLGDTLDIRGEEFISKSKIFIGNNIAPLRIDTYKDALPYFPFLVGSMGSDKEMAYIRISNRSFVDIEEEEMLGWILRDAKKYYRKCKRNKVDFDINEALKKTVMFECDYDEYRPIIEAVKENGEKATVPETVHRPIHDHYRKDLYEEMVKVGYDENSSAIWCFGLGRFLRGDVPEGVVNFRKK